MFGPVEHKVLNYGFCIVQPPAGLLRYINEKIKLYRVDDTNTMTDAIWASIFLLACLHEYDSENATIGKPLVSKFIEDKFPSVVVDGVIPSIRHFYTEMAEEFFKQVIEEFTFSVSRDVLAEWFTELDNTTYITKKKQEDEKKD